jgi:hypothetical protein
MSSSRVEHLHHARIERRRAVLQGDDKRVVAHLAADQITADALEQTPFGWIRHREDP